ncbi:hypothetical protein [Streptococcus anginosus]|uniref:hypothetical protein n=2 Tax=Streptococcus anginosus TaxID=1328 RepID=UPI0021F8DB75|nr:hypothetical protein [Streptococcus anginosus]MCW1050498.1 hypothetical protein [Streptococcus anginosus]
MASRLFLLREMRREMNQYYKVLKFILTIAMLVVMVGLVYYMLFLLVKDIYLAFIILLMWLLAFFVMIGYLMLLF